MTDKKNFVVFEFPVLMILFEKEKQYAFGDWERIDKMKSGMLQPIVASFEDDEQAAHAYADRLNRNAIFQRKPFEYRVFERVDRQE